VSYVELFSGHAEAYAAARPRYPDALFDWVAAIAPNRDLAWDCATGNGQAARGLATRFARVIATDASAAQLAHAEPHPRVEYRQATAEASGLPAASVDAVTVAQALHWFDLAAFFEEVARVLVPGGVLAAWTYNRPRVTPAIDRALDRLHDDTLGAYWANRRHLVDAGYASIEFPFEAIDPPAIRMQTDWTLAEFTAYVRTWSATRRYLAEHHRDPVDALEYELTPLWGEAPHERRAVHWPLSIRASRAPNVS
jgi:ubiquinone/menaquinone biosynthesis C-methylase UbiE